MIAAPATSRQVSGSPSTSAPRISATTGDTNETEPGARRAPVAHQPQEDRVGDERAEEHHEQQAGERRAASPGRAKVAADTGSSASDSRLSPTARDQALRGGQLERRDLIEQRARQHRAERIGERARRRTRPRPRSRSRCRRNSPCRRTGSPGPRCRARAPARWRQPARSCPSRIAKREQEHRVHRHVDDAGDARGDELHAPVEQPIGPDIHQHARQHDAPRARRR